jgi:hypothetical protein
VLDIGGDVGAAVVRTPAILDGSELEIRPVGAPWDGTHTVVRHRGPGCYAALFPAVRRGDYEIRIRWVGPSPVLALTVQGGRVTTALWPSGIICA